MGVIRVILKVTFSVFSPIKRKVRRDSLDSLPAGNNRLTVRTSHKMTPRTRILTFSGTRTLFLAYLALMDSELGSRHRHPAGKAQP